MMIPHVEIAGRCQAHVRFHYPPLDFVLFTRKQENRGLFLSKWQRLLLEGLLILYASTEFVRVVFASNRIRGRGRKLGLIL